MLGRYFKLYHIIFFMRKKIPFIKNFEDIYRLKNGILYSNLIGNKCILYFELILLFIKDYWYLIIFHIKTNIKNDVIWRMYYVSFQNRSKHLYHLPTRGNKNTHKRVTKTLQRGNENTTKGTNKTPIKGGKTKQKR